METTPAAESNSLDLMAGGGSTERMEPSDETPEGGISQRTLLALLKAAGLDPLNAFENDLPLLR